MGGDLQYEKPRSVVGRGGSASSVPKLMEVVELCHLP